MFIGDYGEIVTGDGVTGGGSRKVRVDGVIVAAIIVVGNLFCWAMA